MLHIKNQKKKGENNSHYTIETVGDKKNAREKKEARSRD